MSRRKQIVDALVVELKKINGGAPYSSNVYNNVHNRLKFWDQVNDFPYLCVVAGSESREYEASNQIWGFLNVAIKIYTKDEEDPQDLLETVLADVENNINSLKGILSFGSGEETASIDVISVVTDEGLLTPYAVGEILINLRYMLS